MIIIAAVARDNLCIGKDSHLPWHIPEDMRRFKRLTYGHPLIMGRVTCQGLIRDFGGPLPGRQLIALSHRVGTDIHPDIQVCGSLISAIDHAKPAKQVFIAGGAIIYQEALEFADRLELTLVDGAYDGDTFFPPFKHLIGTTFALTHEDVHEGFSFVTYDRIRPT
ncbi:MAG: dihydrofolate reductase [Bacteroidetes bacterium]|nr:dihydrofolate reductase [Bacteroidota bacterium]